MKELINNREYEDELEKKGIKYIAGVAAVGPLTVRLSTSRATPTR